ncbi:MAG: ABC transporter ATP-binding protein [Prevotella sp.]|nr:ABC transporter ATP-binding protein/permease [Bacteroidales bacterium]MCI6103439.1 ABC transporter ATP-binding protein/permease [Bacteroidales bacterium]MCI7654145.1 ABC transporter ATP-binding protein/permease [Bacteroidales bacterium]MDY4956585.1 ABC transporter ATP-binding protein [Prevotella sp.]MDY5322033.1 ABC transporter ATP-binding protein [Prevotella sp.]
MKIKEILRIPKTHYSSSQIFRWLWRASKTNRTQAIINASIGLLSVVVSLAQVWAVQHAIDVAAGSIPGSLLNAVAFMGLLILANFALNIASVWVRNILGIRAQNRMQQRMLDRILRTEWHGKETLHSGDVLNRLEFDVSNVVVFITETLPNVLSVLMMFLGAFFYLFSLDRILAIITIAIIPVFIVFSKIYVGQMRRYTRQVRDSDSKVQSVLQETIQHRMLIKTLESDDTAVNRLEHTQSELHQNVVRRTKFSLFSNLVLNFGFALGYLVAFAWAALRMSRHTLTFGGMTAYLQLVGRIQGPARNLTKLVPAFVSVFTAAERLMELEEDPLEEQGDPVMLDVPCGVRLNHVYYQYSAAERLVINDLSFDFKPGSSTAVLGETGAGKTTLIRIILALLKPQQGSVTIYDSHESMALTPRMRCNIVYVPQGNTLLSGTIRDNLRLGRLGATDREMAEALHTACADFVFDLPDGLDTECSEAGGGLSEGQAQRISIARALLRDRSIMLFDEATSALDPDTERQLLDNILGRHDRTIIFITHRQAVVGYCDQTLHLEKFHK